ncbi:MAG: hypothetical protein FJ291_11850 [Planctomycetes bacterium]|nr:hypothetical protein [Planctomycetota bacterium]
MDGWDFLTTAESLAKSAHESDRRTSISRSYYASLNGVLCALRPHGVVAKRDHTHQLSEWLRACEDPNLRQVGSKLHTLWAMRIDADYRMELPASEFSIEQAQVAFHEARQILRLFQRTSPRSAAGDIRAYLQKVNSLMFLEKA